MLDEVFNNLDAISMRVRMSGDLWKFYIYIVRKKNCFSELFREREREKFSG